MRRKGKPPQLTPEFSTLPPEFPRLSAETAPPELDAAPEYMPLKDEFSCEGGPAARRPASKRKFYATSAFALIAALILLPAASSPARHEPVESASSSAPAEPSPLLDEPEQVVPCSLFLTYISGSYCMVDAELTEPESIASARIKLTDFVSDTAFYDVDISRTEIDAGRYTAVFDRNPEDIRQYWADYGEGAFPSFSVELAVERTDGETETCAMPVKANVIENISRWYNPDDNTVTVSIFDSVEYAAVFSSPESVDENTLNFTVYVDGEPLTADTCSASYSSEEYDIYSADGTPSGEKDRYYIADITASLPDGVSAETEISFTLDIFHDGHIYTYTENIR